MKTYFIDIDGTIFKHLTNELLEGAKEFLDRIYENDDMLILTTARHDTESKSTEEALSKHGIEYDMILYNLGNDERILINDSKPDGKQTAYSLNVKRNEGMSKYQAWEPGDIFLKKPDKSFKIYSKDGVLKKA